MTSGVEPLTVSFDGTGSSDPDGTVVSYAWAFGDGATASGAITNHVYTAAGSYTAVLTVTDDGGATGSDTVLIVVQADVLAAPVLSGSASGRTASLAWSAVPGADGYYVERGSKRKGRVTWTRVATVGGGETAYSEQPGRGSYSYRVQAFRNSPAETSDYSNEVRLRLR